MQLVTKSSKGSSAPYWLRASSLLIAISGCLLIVSAFTQPFGDKAKFQESTAAAVLHGIGENIVLQIERTVAPAILRTKKLSSNSEIARAIQNRDLEKLASLCNRAVCDSTEVDTIALFDDSGAIIAINNVYADGTPIAQERVDKVLRTEFGDRPIISRCLSNELFSEALEFQTHCDITPAFFDSSGLAVAYSIPIFDPSSKMKIGVVSTRLRMERFTSFINRSFGGTREQVFFVSDAGEYFSESINSGRIPPPIEVSDLKSYVAPMTMVHSGHSHIVRNGEFLEFFRLNNFKTIEGGGIQVMVLADRSWLERETQLAGKLSFGMPFGLGILMLLSSGVAWNSASLFQHRDRFLFAENIRQRLATIIESSEDAIIIEQTDGTIGYWNAGAHSLFGYRSDEVINRPLKMLVPDEQIPEMQQRYEDLLSGKKVSQFETFRKAKDGSKIPVAISISVLRDESGCVVGFSKIVRDIRRHKVAEEELDSARRMAEAANQSKSEFLANMSHEIRTPMTAILGFADLLDSGGEICKDTSFAKNAVQTIRSNANHLLTVINDILDMSKIDAGKMTIENVDVSLIQTIEEVLSLMKAQATGKGISIQVLYETKLPIRIKSDPTRVRQILLNLVGNAIKFTEVGGVTLYTSYLPETNQVQFRIVDTGIGMSRSQVAVISRFGVFSQADTSTTRQFGGSGLGLRISNSLAKMLGGDLTVESENGVGSTFYARVSAGNIDGIEMVDCSLCSSRPIELNETPQSIAQGNDCLPLDGIRILLAEDGPDNQRLLSFVLRKAGAEVTIAENGLIAAELVETDSTCFDLVFMDMQMPELDGYGATSRLRLGGHTIPIIALTAHAMQSDRQKCLEAGCNDYTTKPIDKKILIGMALQYGRPRACPTVGLTAVAGIQTGAVYSSGIR